MATDFDYTNTDKHAQICDRMYDMEQRINQLEQEIANKQFVVKGMKAEMETLAVTKENLCKIIDAENDAWRKENGIVSMHT